MPRSGVQFVTVLLLAAGLLATASAQGTKKPISKPETKAEPQAGTRITNARVVYEQGAPAIEVVSTQPVVPTVQMLDSPPRLVIDLANTHLAMQRKRIPVLKENILTIRAEQYQIEPAITRIVVDLLVPCGYTWDAAGNRLTVRLKPAEDSNAEKKAPLQPQPASTPIPAVAGAIVPLSNGVGDAVLSGKSFAEGSSLTAGTDTAVLRLARGGEVRICPGTMLSVTPSKSSKNLMLGLSTGSLETHYTLKETADTVLTPDFRILLAGPGEFHYAVSADAHGNTCVRGLKGNASSAIVYELMGDRIYQVKPSEQLVFHSGRIDQVDGDVPPECGCPPPAPVMPADGPQPAVRADASSRNVRLADRSAIQPAGAAPNRNTGNGTGQTLSNGPEVRPLPPSQPNDIHIQVEAPLVFHGKEEPGAAPAEAPKAPPVTESSGHSAQVAQQGQTPAQAPPAQAPAPDTKPEAEQHHRVLHKIKGFFAALFR